MEVAGTTASFSEFANLRGFKKSYVTELKAAGRLVLTDDGKRVMVAESIQRIADTKDPSKNGVTRRHEAERVAKAVTTAPVSSTPEIDAPEASGDDETIRYQNSRAKREYYLAKTAELDYKKAEGELMVAADVISAVASAMSNLRSAFENLPGKWASQIAPITDEKQCIAMLTDAVEKALADAAKSFAKIGKPA